MGELFAPSVMMGTIFSRYEASMDKQLIFNIINTLEQVEVHGSANLNRLLGCIQALESIIQQEQSEGESEDG